MSFYREEMKLPNSGSDKPLTQTQCKLLKAIHKTFLKNGNFKLSEIKKHYNEPLSKKQFMSQVTSIGYKFGVRNIAVSKLYAKAKNTKKLDWIFS